MTHLEQVVEQVGMLLQVEGDALVERLLALDLDCHVLELDVLPGNGRVRDHHVQRVVVLVVLQQ